MRWTTVGPDGMHECCWRKERAAAHDEGERLHSYGRRNTRRNEGADTCFKSCKHFFRFLAIGNQHKRNVCIRRRQRAYPGFGFGIANAERTDHEHDHFERRQVRQDRWRCNGNDARSAAVSPWLEKAYDSCTDRKSVV